MQDGHSNPNPTRTVTTQRSHQQGGGAAAAVAEERLFHQLCSLLFSLLRCSSMNPLSISQVPLRRRLHISPLGFAWLLLGMAFALIMLGSVTFMIGMMMMPLVAGLAMLLYIVGILSNLSLSLAGMTTLTLDPAYGEPSTPASVCE